jgi:tetratricopeptide (TPR) repeat protein
VEALLGLAEIEARAGDRGAAGMHLARAVGLAPARPDVHARYAALTGPAPATAAMDAATLVARAERHPYDPGARLAAGEALLASGDAAAARPHLETALVLADLDPSAAHRAAARLRASAPEWRTRRIVPVYALADETLRADPAWRFQLRFAWIGVSQALASLLDVSFVVTGVAPFRSEGAGFDLPAITAAARAQHPALPASDGILFVATGVPAPKQPGAWKAGEAELLGRVLTVRLARGEVASRALAHEVIHLYGGVHVSPDVDALMNPSGTSRAMDPWNAAILRATRARRFGPGGIEANVVPHVDLATTIEAYRAALRANVALRNAGIVEALGESGGSARGAASGLRDAMRLDEHLGDVAAFLAQLLLRDGRPAGAARMWSVAAQLYGPGDPRARIAARNARALAGVR